MAREHLVTARVEHRCDRPGRFEDCKRLIEPGEDYVRAVAFYDDDGVWQRRGWRPWVMKICMPCATAYGRPAPTERRKRRRR